MNNKISILISSLDFGGAERVVSVLLEEFNKKEIEVILVLMDKTIKYKLPKNQEVVYLMTNDLSTGSIKKLLLIPYLALKYKKICSKYKIEISLSFMNRSNYINILSSLMGNNINVLISERIVPSNEYSSSSLKDKISHYLIKFLYPKADKILPNSLGIKNDLVKKFYIKKELIKVINNPIDFEEIQRKRISDNSLLDKRKYNFITIGRLHPQKNHNLLLDAIKEIDANLYIIGEGTLREELEKNILDLNLSKKVFLLGKRDNPFEYLNQADCFVFSSNYEGFPNVLLEALACELPIISTNCESGPDELLELKEDFIYGINYAKYGLLVPTNDTTFMKEAMLQMMQNQDLRNRYKSLALNRSKEFDTSTIIDRYLDVLSIYKK